MIGRICFCLAALSVSVIGRAAASDEAEVLSILKGGVDEVFGIVYGPNETGELLSVRLRPVLEKYFDFSGITRRAVGPRWREFSSEQQTAVLSLFSDVVLRTYIDSFEPGEQPGIKYGQPLQLSDTRWELPTTIEYAGSEYSVAYRMSKGKQGWQVYDVVIEGVSMISNYRGQFDAILQKGGVQSLIDSLTENLRKVSQPK